MPDDLLPVVLLRGLVRAAEVDAEAGDADAALGAPAGEQVSPGAGVSPVTRARTSVTETGTLVKFIRVTLTRIIPA